jgi:hypothetical protein
VIALWIVLSLLLAAVGGWPVTAGVLRAARTADALEATDPARAAGDVSGDVADDGARELSPGEQLTSTEVLRGGLVIGILERSAVVLAILAGQPIAIAYVVAIKALGRYPELKQTPAASERFIIGTLASMLWAAGIGTLTKWLLVG